MNQILCKFKCGSVTNFGNNNVQAQLSPVINDREENKSFSIYTPSGKLELHVTNPSVIGFFEPDGYEYEILITKKEKKERN